MITGDLTAAVAAAAATAVAAGDLPGDGGLGSHPGLASGTWRPVPAEAGGGPGRYATTLPFVLARRLAAAPARVAAVLAEALRLAPGVAGVGDVRVSGGGYLSITVTPDALARLAIRITEGRPGMCPEPGPARPAGVRAARRPAGCRAGLAGCLAAAHRGTRRPAGRGRGRGGHLDTS